MFTYEEKIEILRQLGYQLQLLDDDAMPLKYRMYNHNKKYEVKVNGEWHDVEAIFKQELKKRIFNL